MPLKHLCGGPALVALKVPDQMEIACEIAHFWQLAFEFLDVVLAEFAQAQCS